tara:strand:- start:144 stop:566 length:423 start_codon:yes stop_codon:yes gene_type:complete
MLLDRILHTYTIIFVFLGIILIPQIFPLLSEYEGKILPVVSTLEIFDETTCSTRNCVEFNVKINKKRQCEFLGINWYSSKHRRLQLIFEPELPNTPKSRPTGLQIAGPWILYGVDSLKDTYALVAHRCHPFWVTYTNLYP